MTATTALQVAIADALEDRPALMALLAPNGIHSGMAPAGTPLVDPVTKQPWGYIVLGGSTEGAKSTIMQPGHEGTETLHLWSGDVSKYGVQRIYAEVEAALHLVPLALNGHTWIEGRVEYVTDFADSDGKARQLVARYRVVSRVGA